MSNFVNHEYNLFCVWMMTMKRFIIFLIYLFSMDVALANVCVPEPGNKLKVVGVKSDDTLNVRTGFTIKFPVIGELGPSTVRNEFIDVSIKTEECQNLCKRFSVGEKNLKQQITTQCLNKNKIWFFIKTELGFSGWASGKYLAEYKDKQSSPLKVDKADRLEVERLAAEKRAAEQQIASRLEAERLAAENRAAERLIASRVEAERLMAVSNRNLIFSLGVFVASLFVLAVTIIYFLKKNKKKEIPSGFFLNKDGTVSIDHDTSLDRGKPREEKKLKEGLIGINNLSINDIQNWLQLSQIEGTIDGDGDLSVSFELLEEAITEQPQKIYLIGSQKLASGGKSETFDFESEVTTNESNWFRSRYLSGVDKDDPRFALNMKLACHACSDLLTIPITVKEGTLSDFPKEIGNIKVSELSIILEDGDYRLEGRLNGPNGFIYGIETLTAEPNSEQSPRVAKVADDENTAEVYEFFWDVKKGDTVYIQLANYTKLDGEIAIGFTGKAEVQEPELYDGDEDLDDDFDNFEGTVHAITIKRSEQISDFGCLSASNHSMDGRELTLYLVNDVNTEDYHLVLEGEVYYLASVEEFDWEAPKYALSNIQQKLQQVFSINDEQTEQLIFYIQANVTDEADDLDEAQFTHFVSECGEVNGEDHFKDEKDAASRIWISTGQNLSGVDVKIDTENFSIQFDHQALEEKEVASWSKFKLMTDTSPAYEMEEETGEVMDTVSMTDAVKNSAKNETLFDTVQHIALIKVSDDIGWATADGAANKNLTILSNSSTSKGYYFIGSDITKLSGNPSDEALGDAEQLFINELMSENTHPLPSWLSEDSNWREFLMGTIHQDFDDFEYETGLSVDFGSEGEINFDEHIGKIGLRVSSISETSIKLAKDGLSILGETYSTDDDLYQVLEQGDIRYGLFP